MVFLILKDSLAMKFAPQIKHSEAHINKIQQDGTICRYFLIAKLL